MKNIYNQIVIFIKSPLYYLPFIVSLAVNLLIWLVIIWRLPIQTSWIPLHYNIYFGINWIGPWIQIFLYPLVGFLIIIFNCFLTLLILYKNKSLSIVLNYISLLVQIIILAGLITLLIKYFV